jgi:hypothetical protein
MRWSSTFDREKVAGVARRMQEEFHTAPYKRPCRAKIARELKGSRESVRRIEQELLMNGHVVGPKRPRRTRTRREQDGDGDGALLNRLEQVFLMELFNAYPSRSFRDHRAKLSHVMGKDVSNVPESVIADFFQQEFLFAGTPSQPHKLIYDTLYARKDPQPNNNNNNSKMERVQEYVRIIAKMDYSTIKFHGSVDFAKGLLNKVADVFSCSSSSSSSFANKTSVETTIAEKMNHLRLLLLLLPLLRHWWHSKIKQQRRLYNILPPTSRQLLNKMSRRRLRRRQ